MHQNYQEGLGPPLLGLVSNEGIPLSVRFDQPRRLELDKVAVARQVELVGALRARVDQPKAVHLGAEKNRVLKKCSSKKIPFKILQNIYQKIDNKNSPKKFQNLLSGLRRM
jgi:hypothetical protein